MKQYFCKLVNKGYVQESFFREGESAEAVKEDLELFHWPEGEWIISDADNEEDNS